MRRFLPSIRILRRLLLHGRHWESYAGCCPGWSHYYLEPRTSKQTETPQIVLYRHIKPDKPKNEVLLQWSHQTKQTKELGTLTMVTSNQTNQRMRYSYNGHIKPNKPMNLTIVTSNQTNQRMRYSYNGHIKSNKPKNKLLLLWSHQTRQTKEWGTLTTVRLTQTHQRIRYSYYGHIKPNKPRN